MSLSVFIQIAGLLLIYVLFSINNLPAVYDVYSNDHFQELDSSITVLASVFRWRCYYRPNVAVFILFNFLSKLQRYIGL